MFKMMSWTWGNLSEPYWSGTDYLSKKTKIKLSTLPIPEKQNKNLLGSWVTTKSVTRWFKVVDTMKFDLKKLQFTWTDKYSTETTRKQFISKQIKDNKGKWK